MNIINRQAYKADVERLQFRKCAELRGQCSEQIMVQRQRLQLSERRDGVREVGELVGCQGERAQHWFDSL